MTDPNAHTDPPPADQLREVSDAEAAEHAQAVGDLAAQSADHPYDPGGDPYARLAEAGRAGAVSTDIDPRLPGAAPRAGG